MDAPERLPYTAPEEIQAQQDGQHLDLLVILWYVNMVFGLIPGIIGTVYLAMGSIFVWAPVKGSGSQEMMIPFALLGGIGTFLLLVSAVLMGLSFFTARSIRNRRNRTFVTVVAGLNCLHMPLGTALGVFTLMVTQRPSVKALFV